MKYLLGAAIMFLVLLGDGRAELAVRGQQPAPAATPATASPQKAEPGTSEGPIKPSVKQLALQAQIDRLVALGTELKDHVDKTNKNILSIKVVRKAEEIEQFAKRMKEQNRK